MTYSSLFLDRSKKIPFFAVVIALSLVLVMVSFFLKKPPIASRANVNDIRNLTLVNVSSNNFGITWSTDIPKVGWIVYGLNENELNKIALDERDVADKKNVFKNHWIQFKDLEKKTTYYYKITDGTQLIGDKNNKAFTFTTMAEDAGRPNNKPSFGKVVEPNGQPASNIFVYLTVEGAFPLFTVSKDSGEWLISLSALYDTATSRQRSVKPADRVEIHMIDESGKVTDVHTSVADLSPLPQTVILGTNYTLQGEGNVLAASDQVNQAKSSEVSIIYPKEKSIIPGKNPLIKGTAPPGNNLLVSITNSNLKGQRVVSDGNGNWAVAVGQELSAGEHTLSVIAKDSSGKQSLYNRTFNIAKSGEQVVLGEATKEATPTQAATGAPTTQPTTSPQLSITYSPTATPTIPVTGSDPVPLMVLSGGMVIVGLGLLIAF